MYTGGAVAGMVSDQPNRGYWGFWDVIFSPLILLGEIAKGVENSGIIQGTTKSIGDAVHSTVTNVMGAEVINRFGRDVVPGLSKAIITAAAAYVSGGLGGGAAYAALGAGAASGSMTYAETEDMQTTAISAAMAAVAAYYAAGSSGATRSAITADMVGNSAYNTAIEAGASEATAQAAYETAYNAVAADYIKSALAEAVKGFATRYAIGAALGAAFPNETEKGKLSIDYMGASDNGLIGSLSSLMRQIAPQSSTFAFSAANGLDYVPRDNFRINAHKGEAVLNRKNAEEWRNNVRRRTEEADNNLPPVQVNLMLDGRAIGGMLYKQTKAGVKVIHSRGITDI